MPELKTLRLDNNDLEDPPDALSKAPKLSEISFGDNFDITQNPAKMKDLRARFPIINFDFEDEYDCLEK